MSESPRYRRRTRSQSPYSPIDGESCTVFVGGLAPETDDRALREFFTTVGHVLETKVVYDNETSRSKGFGFVKFADPRDAADAVADCDGKTLDGNNIRCNIAKYPPPKARGRGPIRARGVGRGRSRSPRGRSGSQSVSYSSGRSRSPEYSRSPPPKRRRPHSPPQRARPPPRAKRARSEDYSRSGSSAYSGSSYSSSGSEGGSRSPVQRAPPLAATRPPPPPGVFKKELLQAKRREQELTTRVAALEHEVKQSRTARLQLQNQVDELQHEMQERDQVIAMYRKWLTAVLGCSSKVMEGKKRIAQAERETKLSEEDLSVLVAEAGGFIDKETKAASELNRQKQERQVKLAERQAQEVREAQQAVQPPDIYATLARHSSEERQVTNGPHNDRDPIADDKGGWAEDLHEGEHRPDPAAKFKPGIKFKLAA